MENRGKFLQDAISFKKAQKRRKQVYKYVQDICAGKYKDGKEIRYPLITEVEDFIRWGVAEAGIFGFFGGVVAAPFVSSKIHRQKNAQAVIDSAQQPITSAQEQVEAIRVQQQDSILQPQVDEICDELMAKYDCLDLSDSTASTLLDDLKQAYHSSYNEERLYTLSPFPHYYTIKPEYKQFYSDYSGIRAELTPKITQLQEETPIDVHTLPESILPSDLLALSEANVFDFVDPSIVADSQINTIVPAFTMGLEGSCLGVIGVCAIAGYSQLRNQRFGERWHDYEMATDLCLRGQQMKDYADGKSPKLLGKGDLNFTNDADVCPETIAFATRPTSFDEFNRSFDEYMKSCETRQNIMAIKYDASVFEPYSCDDDLFMVR